MILYRPDNKHVAVFTLKTGDYSAQISAAMNETYHQKLSPSLLLTMKDTSSICSLRELKKPSSFMPISLKSGLKRIVMAPLCCGMLILTIGLTTLTANAEGRRVFIDTIVASVDGKPITLSDLSKKVGRKLTVQDAQSDAVARTSLDELIHERLIKLEAESKNMAVASEDVESYIDEVAKRNGMDRTQFETALKESGKTLPEYREQIQLEILRSRLTAAYIRSAGAVTDSDIKEYAKSSGIIKKPAGTKIKLRQIFISSELHPGDNVDSRLALVLTKLDEDEDFDEVAKELSDSADAKDGGLIGEVAFEDLDRQIFEAVSSLESGETSKPIKSPDGVRLFHVDERIEQKQEEVQELDAETKEQIRKALEQEKLQSKIAAYINEELYKIHAVDKKI